MGRTRHTVRRYSKRNNPLYQSKTKSQALGVILALAGMVLAIYLVSIITTNVHRSNGSYEPFEPYEINETYGMDSVDEGEQYGVAMMEGEECRFKS